MIRLIIFDLDGTLVDSSVDLTNALNHAILPYGIEPLTVQNTISLVGEGITRLIEKLCSPYSDEVRKAVLDRFLDYYSEHLTDFTRPYPGVGQTLEALAGYSKAVISNKRESLSLKVLANLGLLGYFDMVLGSDSTNEKKPSPLPLLKVMESLGRETNETIMVGDSNFDIEAAQAAGVRSVAVSYGYRDVALLKGAAFVIETFPDIRIALEKLNAERYDA